MVANSNVSPFSFAIILLYWNDMDTLLKVLGELKGQLPEKTSIWIVDNASDKPFPIEVKDMPSTHLLRSEINLGYSGGVNLALKEILKKDYDFILLLNSDVHFIKGDLGSFMRIASNHAKNDILGPVISEGEIKYYGGRDPGKYLNTRLTTPIEVDYIPGTCFLCKTAVFRQIGLLDEDFFFSGEIADFCRRARDRGMTLGIEYGFELQHEIEKRGSLRSSLYLYYNLRNRFHYIDKHNKAGRPLISVLWFLRGLRILVGAILMWDWHRVRATCWAIFDGILGNFGNRNDRFL